MSDADRVYLDYAAATPVRAEALASVVHAVQLVGNPGGLHKESVEAKKVLSDARAGVARVLGATAREVVFVSGATEANNLAIRGRAQYILRERGSLSGTHWITSAIEHDAVLQPLAEIERLGGTITHIDPNAHGILTSESVSRALRSETVFISIGWSNSEIGTVQSIAQIAACVRAHEARFGTRVVFHSDAGQAPLYEKTTFRSLGVDLLSVDSGKLYGPRGIGALVLASGVPIEPIIFGGAQESGMRPGTENVALAAGFSVALAMLLNERESEAHRAARLRDLLYTGLSEKIPTIIRNGTRDVLPHILNITIPGISTEYFVLSLDAAGFAVSTKSACREGKAGRSHVVEALGDFDAVSVETRAAHTVRFSLGHATTEDDIRRCVTACVAIYTRMLQQQE